MSKKKITLLQVLPSLQVGGVERGTVDIAVYAAANGFNSIVISNGGRMVSEAETGGAKHIKLPLASKNPLVMIKNIFAIKDIIKKYNVDIVHARSRAPAWSAYFATHKTAAKFVTTFHGTYSFKFIFKRFYNSIMTKGIKVVAVSNFVKSHILENYKCASSKIKVIHRGVDENKFNAEKISSKDIKKFKSELDINESTPIIFMPARITRWKGQDLLFKALRNIAEMDFVCVIAGSYGKSGEYFNELQNLLVVTGLYKKVRFIGDAINLPVLYAASDVVINASRRAETFGRISIEAQSMGKPIIATAIGGSIETIINGETGFLFPVDDEKQLASSIQKILNMSASEKAEIALKARKNIVDNFTLHKMCEETIAIYKEVLADNN
jgi:glycosyltransferase involved in cell wall biosynthesis